jgi:CO/xanthine dehydrogenase FAD-binding subunit
MKQQLPGLPSFDYIRAETSEQVTDLLQKHPIDLRLFLGGTDIFVQMRDGLLEPKFLVDVKHLPGMTSIVFDPKDGLSIGAAVSLNALIQHPAVKKIYPLLAEAANSIASYQIRNRATVGGNLCNASPAADTAPAILVLEASLITVGPKGERKIHIEDFFLSPGETALKKDEFLTRIDVPIPPKDWRGRYLKLGRNAGGDLAVVGVAILGYPDESTSSHYSFRIGLASVAPTPIRVPDAEEILANNLINEEAIDMAARAARETTQPIDDVRASALYRNAMVQALTRRGLQEIWATIRKDG